MPADRNGREDALLHSLLAGAGSERIVNNNINTRILCILYRQTFNFVIKIETLSNYVACKKRTAQFACNSYRTFK